VGDDAELVGRKGAGLGLEPLVRRGLELAVVLPAGMPALAKEAAMAEILSTPRHVLLSTWKHFPEYPTEDTLANVRCPFLSSAAPSRRTWKGCGPSAHRCESPRYGTLGTSSS
jgi:hypothetical protein